MEKKGFSSQQTTRLHHTKLIKFTRHQTTRPWPHQPLAPTTATTMPGGNNSKKQNNPQETPKGSVGRTPEQSDQRQHKAKASADAAMRRQGTNASRSQTANDSEQVQPMIFQKNGNNFQVALTDVAVTPHSGTDLSTMTSDANAAWHKCERASKNACELQQDLRSFVRNALFPSCKMITNKNQLNFKWEKESLCQFVCDGMNVLHEHKVQWWETNKDTVSVTLNRRRSDVSAQIKKAFMGESKMQ